MCSLWKDPMAEIGNSTSPQNTSREKKREIHGECISINQQSIWSFPRENKYIIQALAN